MTVRIRFFARFRELLGTDIQTEIMDGTTLRSLITTIAQRNPEGHAAIFDDNGMFHEFVILMKNGKRIELGEASDTLISDGDEVAVFPPVAGG